MKNKGKNILIAVLISIGVILLGVIISVSITFNTFSSIFSKLKEEYFPHVDYDEKYGSIIQELFDKNLINNNWKYAGQNSEWGLLGSVKNHKYYFYINKEDYDNYKYYWDFSNENNSKYYEGYNEFLKNTGDYIFHMIELEELKYSEDIDYGNMHLNKNNIYYLIEIYDKALYYKYVARSTDKGNIIEVKSDYDRDSLLKEYIFHNQNNKWVIDELIR